MAQRAQCVPVCVPESAGEEASGDPRARSWVPTKKFPSSLSRQTNWSGKAGRQARRRMMKAVRRAVSAYARKRVSVAALRAACFADAAARVNFDVPAASSLCDMLRVVIS